MKITKLVHSCLLVETADRTALFDPGVMSTVPIDTLTKLDDIVITHGHSDHFDLDLVKRLTTRFPDTHITAPDEVVTQLNSESIPATSAASSGIAFFDSPHQAVYPIMATEPQELGIHYLDQLSHPGDSHSFHETKAILALPVQAPWGSSVDAVLLALKLKPKYVIPIHDWHWRDEVRESMYIRMQQIFDEQGMTFISAVNGEAFTINL